MHFAFTFSLVSGVFMQKNSELLANELNRYFYIISFNDITLVLTFVVNQT